jgi:hypothetical protein
MKGAQTASLYQNGFSRYFHSSGAAGQEPAPLPPPCGPLWGDVRQEGNGKPYLLEIKKLSAPFS